MTGDDRTTLAKACHAMAKTHAITLRTATARRSPKRLVPTMQATPVAARRIATPEYHFRRNRVAGDNETARLLKISSCRGTWNRVQPAAQKHHDAAGKTSPTLIPL